MMSEEARAAQREYYKQYRQKNRKRLNDYHKKWIKENYGSRKNYEEKYWERKAAEMKEQAGTSPAVQEDSESA